MTVPAPGKILVVDDNDAGLEPVAAHELGLADGGHAALVPVHLLVVAAGFRVVVERLRVPQLGALVVVLHHLELGVVEFSRGVLNRLR